MVLRCGALLRCKASRRLIVNVNLYYFFVKSPSVHYGVPQNDSVYTSFVYQLKE